MCRWKTELVARSFYDKKYLAIRKEHIIKIITWLKCIKIVDFEQALIYTIL